MDVANISELYSFHQIEFNEDGSLFIHDAVFRYGDKDMERDIWVTRLPVDLHHHVLSRVFMDWEILKALLTAIKENGVIL